MNHVAISPELLEKMSTDEEVRRQVENVLNHLDSYQKSAQTSAFLKDKELVGMGLVLSEDGQVSMWTATTERDKEKVYPTYWRDRESTSFYSKHAKNKGYSSPYNYSHSTNMMRLANARNVTAVRGLISAKYGEIQKAVPVYSGEKTARGDSSSESESGKGSQGKARKKRTCI